MAQNGYKKDSLQIKVYTSISYANNKIKAIKVKRVFCNYCTDFQILAIKQEAKNRSYSVRNDKENKLVNGTKKLTLFIRIAKSDFAAIREDN
ncbi:MAG: hypothetical protein HRT67_05515 [Flavobacteriaceae bacterium]|nr:hypothetical protein [Flavobacteriaceae bacterium]